MIKRFTPSRLSGALLCSLSLVASLTFAQASKPSDVKVDSAWVRATAPGQLGTGAYMNITANTRLQLVGVSTPAAAVAEVHEMRMDGDIMRMRAVPALDLPPGQTVQLKPGGYHLMLMDLPKALPKDSQMPLTLHFKNPAGVESRLQIKVPVRTAAPSGPAVPAAGTSSTVPAQPSAHRHGKH